MFRVTVYKFIAIVAILLCTANSASAQLDSVLINSKASYLKKAGKRALKSGDYYGAIEYFKKYLEKKPENTKIKYKLADSYRLSRDYQKALFTYQMVIKDDAESYGLAYYYLAKMQIHVQEYQKAIISFGKFKKKYDGKDKSIFKKRMKLLLLTCEQAMDISKKTWEISIGHLDTSINKAHIEASPFMLDSNILIYSSLRSDTIVYYDANDTTKKYPVRRFYGAIKDGKGSWVFNKEYEMNPVNDEKSHNTNACYNLDSTSIFFTRCELNQKGKMICSIYESTKDGNEWGEAKKLPETVNMPEYSSTQPAIGRGVKYGAEVLYFISNRPRGKGGKDIWYSEYYPKKKTFKKAKNAGSKINTALDEMTPFYDLENKTMYFSSEGWPGIGGLDVFSSTGELKSWEPPTNMGTPINTSTDELYYIQNQEGDQGFFISNRKGGITLKNETCCDDLYEYKELKHVYLGIGGSVFDLYSDTNNRDSAVVLQNAVLSLYALPDSADGEPILIKQTQSNEKGKYFFKLKKDKRYLVKANHDQTLSSSYQFSTKNKTASDTTAHAFNLRHVTEKPIVVKNIYYEFDKSDLTQSSTTTIDTTLLIILEQNPSIVIEIGSHTDSKGTDKYNETLSQQRAESVVQYLISKGISQKRLKAKGYGESTPIAPNQNEDRSDNPEGRARNRRTEFKIVGTVKGVSEVIYKQ